MKPNFRTIAEFLGIAAVIASLLFVGFELRLTRSIAESEGLADSSELMRGLREFIAEYSNVWYRGCLGEELTESESVIFASIVQARINYGFTQWARTGSGISGASKYAIAGQVALNRYRYPGFDKAWIDNDLARAADSTFDSWPLDVEEQYQALIDSGAPREFDVAWCGR